MYFDANTKWVVLYIKLPKYLIPSLYSGATPIFAELGILQYYTFLLSVIVMIHKS